MSIGRTNAGSGGGGGLNFKVVKNPQPTTPKENTIWVKTDIDIPYWTTASSAKAPAYVAKKGTVNFWWESATSTEVSGTTAAGFMPVKYKATNPPGYMRLKPINCYQNQDGTETGWKSMEAYIYKGGTWVQFLWEEYRIFENGEFFNGIEFESSNKIVFNSGYSGVAPTQSVSDGDWKIYMASGSGASGCVISKAKIDLTKISSIKTHVVSGTSENDPDEYRALYIGLYSSNSYQLYTNAVAIVSKYYPITNEDLILDTSEITGSYYLAVFIHGWNNEINVFISKMNG